jgi:hypothetical protein
MRERELSPLRAPAPRSARSSRARDRRRGPTRRSARKAVWDPTRSLEREIPRVAFSQHHFGHDPKGHRRRRRGCAPTLHDAVGLLSAKRVLPAVAGASWVWRRSPRAGSGLLTLSLSAGSRTPIARALLRFLAGDSPCRTQGARDDKRAFPDQRCSRSAARIVRPCQRVPLSSCWALL